MTQIKTKYVTIDFHEDHDGAKPFYWVAVGFVWTEKAQPVAKLFAHLMDDIMLSEIRGQLAEAVNNPIKDIYHEDVDIIIHLRADSKHLAAKLLGIVESVEARFDNLVEVGHGVVAK